MHFNNDLAVTSLPHARGPEWPSYMKFAGRRHAFPDRGFGGVQWHNTPAIACTGWHGAVDTRAMTLVFNIGDRARLPWRFYGATRSVLARI